MTNIGNDIVLMGLLATRQHYHISHGLTCSVGYYLALNLELTFTVSNILVWYNDTYTPYHTLM